MSLPGIRGAMVAAAMLGFAGAQRLDSLALQAKADHEFVMSAKRYVEDRHYRHRSAPFCGRGVGNKLAKSRAAVRGW